MNETAWVLIVLLGIWVILRLRSQAGDATPRRSIQEEPAHHWSDGENFDFEVVGESYYQPAIKKILATCDNDLVAIFD